MASAVSCWHCRSRRWQCDREKPACQKCTGKGLQCPGYGGTRPIRFRDPRAPSSFQPAASKQVCLKKSGARRARGIANTVPTSACEVVRPPQPLASQPPCPSLDVALSSPGEKSLIEGLEYMCFSTRPCYEGSYLKTFAQPTSSSSVMRKMFFADPRPIEIMAGIRVCSLLAFLEVNKDCIAHASLVALRTRLLEYTGVAYSMVTTIMNYNDIHSPATLAEAIHYLMFLEIMQVRTEPIWQIHAKAAARLYLQNPMASVPTYACFQFAMLVTMNNTTSLRTQQVYAERFPCHIPWMGRYHDQTRFAAFASPWPLVEHIIRINSLRAQYHGREVPSDRLEKLLRKIESFEHKEWAASHTLEGQQSIWMYLGKITKTAVAAFALASLSQRPFTQSRSAKYRDNLFAMLDDTVANEYLVQFGLQWHFIVAGFLAKTGTVAQRNYVRRYFEWSRQISAFRGRALTILEHFWMSESYTEWDECFSEPYFLVGF